MTNLQVLSNESLIDIILEMDTYITELLNTNDAMLVEKDIQIRSLQRKLSEINDTRQYWKDKFHSLKDPSRKIVEDDVKVETTPEVKFDEKNRIVKKTYNQSVESTAGNLKGTSHSGHKTKDEVLVGLFPDGVEREFDTVNDAKDYVRATYKEFAHSPLTNISAAARQYRDIYKKNGGMSYNIKWWYKSNNDAIDLDDKEAE